MVHCLTPRGGYHSAITAFAKDWTVDFVTYDQVSYAATNIFHFTSTLIVKGGILTFA